ncbi:armadillo repeat-containing protein 7-like [Haliotis rubra]|uniref:armadillo repeat-containing protein 7-like n=1 Tax=Haliotis rubra TaxID=36100 RepID=UPI001EE63018|nr:armadillo repeat-containing protein 7-like [Haliotis rubra]
MFSSQEYLDRKTGPYGIGRFSYLQSLVTEYQDIDDQEAKQQVLANLANFAYDPINYDYFRKLNVLDLFLDALDESDEKLVEFGVGGLCNCVLDKLNKEYILQNGGVALVINCLSSPVEETVLSAITTLMYLITNESKQEITALPVVECMLRFSRSLNKRLSNLALVFLQDYCTRSQVQEAQEVQQQQQQQPPHPLSEQVS